METKQGCKKCSAHKIFFKQNWILVTFSVYFLIAAIYGTVQIVKDITSIF